MNFPVVGKVANFVNKGGPESSDTTFRHHWNKRKEMMVQDRRGV